MSKNWLLITLTIVIIVVLLLFNYSIKSDQESSNLVTKNNVLNASDNIEAVDLVVNGNKQSASWFEVGDVNEISLLNNLEGRMDSRQIVEDEGCSSLVNGGFYSEEYEPIGLFVTNYETINRYRSNSLLNGFIYINNSGVVEITDKYDDGEYKVALQTGPTLINDGVVRELNIRNDEPARRMVAAVTKDDKLIFLTFFDKESHFLGPTLSDLPLVVKSVSEEYGLGISDAINLDGGSASVFVTENVNLRELSTVGSFFCVK